jgi:hypothetical protein
MRKLGSLKASLVSTLTVLTEEKLNSINCKLDQLETLLDRLIFSSSEESPRANQPGAAR